MHANAEQLIRVGDNNAYSLHSAIELFLESVAAAGRRPATVRFYRIMLSAFAQRVNTSLDQIDH
ncbi:MAG: hypothetical protein NZ809_06245, partial [Thermodesulfovibrio sp.]|nr:hypothetical protein [Thermodesulfovibrio sp.]